MLEIMQLGGVGHTFVPTPTYTPVLLGSGNLPASSGTISTTFALGGGATGWEASENLGYVSLTPSSGDASTPVVVTYDANGTFETREVVITITTTGLSGIPLSRDISITQSGAPGLSVTTAPLDLASLTATTGTISVDVDFLGSAEGWDAEITSDPGGFSEFE